MEAICKEELKGDESRCKEITQETVADSHLKEEDNLDQVDGSRNKETDGFKGNQNMELTEFGIRTTGKCKKKKNESGISSRFLIQAHL